MLLQKKIQLEILESCLHYYKIRKIQTTPNISWWNQRLEIKKKELNALKRRVKKSTGVTRDHYQKVYSEKRVIYKKEILHVKRSTWKTFCGKASSPYGGTFKSAKPANPLSVIFNMLGNPLTGNGKAFEGKILQQLYPEAVGEQTDISFTPSFSAECKIQINNFLKRFPKSKAPGFEGIDSVIVPNIHSNVPELLTTFMNKCLDLKKLPTLFKTRLIVPFHKKGKEKNSINS
ncbi:hypothetical protein AVEN_163044-1 [Araneus ventricosus]|uniref:Reverse transcriptase domain-containing protein n=1 Tax=Araneus ventricosus TaxID=182803 RepID=A0A4Y2J8X6_ARAVE|nr:hypothetical protein AVEN_163044-1 [Araneus ventricosus]